MLESIGIIETTAVLVAGVGSLLYALFEAAAYGTNAVPLHVFAGIAGYVAVWLYALARAS